MKWVQLQPAVWLLAVPRSNKVPTKKKMKNTLVRVGGFPVSFKSPPFHCHADQLDDGRSRSIRQTDPAEVKSKETRILLPPLG